MGGAQFIRAASRTKKSGGKGNPFREKPTRREIYSSPLLQPRSNQSRLTVGSFSSPFHGGVGRFTANNDAFNDQRRRYRDDPLTSAMQSRETATYAIGSCSPTPITAPNFLRVTAVIPFLGYVCFLFR